MNDYDLETEEAHSAVTPVMFPGYSLELPAILMIEVHARLDIKTNATTWFKGLQLTENSDYTVLHGEVWLTVYTAVAITRSSNTGTKGTRNTLIAEMIKESTPDVCTAGDTLSAHITAEDAILENMYTGMRSVLNNYAIAHNTIQQVTYETLGYKEPNVVEDIEEEE